MWQHMFCVSVMRAPHSTHHRHKCKILTGDRWIFFFYFKSFFHRFRNESPREARRANL